MITSATQVVEPQAEPAAPNVTMRYGHLAFQVSALGVALFAAGYVVLYMDHHNDERYLQKEAYQKDRGAEKDLRDEVNRGITRRLDDQDKRLERIDANVVELLRRK